MWNKIEMLPKWCIPNTNPAFYDTESATAIEQTAKLYGKVRELIDAYNEFVGNVETLIEEFEKSVTTDMETFKLGIRQEFQDFIDVVNLRLQQFEVEFDTFKGDVNNLINEYKNYLDTKYSQFTTNILNQFETLRTEVNTKIENQNTTISNAIESQNTAINNAIEYMSTNIEQTTINIINQKIENGDIAVGLVYNDATESLDLVVESEE